ncbi:MAG: hypothetical protein ACFFCQ_14620 [Promethearchaeota archaeon]
MSSFEDARIEWKAMSSKVSWYMLFGDLYVVKYPRLSAEESADSIKKSIFEADDSVHAWSAGAVRERIKERLMQADQRGIIREWYANLGFLCERMNYLKGIPEQDIDYVTRTSFLGDISTFRETQVALLEHLDPQTKVITEEIINKITEWGRPQLEFYGLLTGMNRRLFAFTDEEIMEIIEFLLDSEKADKFLRKRFIEFPEGEEEIFPFIGEGHPDIRTEENFILKYIANGDSSFYPHRIIQLWLHTLLKSDPLSRKVVEEESFLKKLSDDLNEAKVLILDSIYLLKFMVVQAQFLGTLRGEYATKADYPGYASQLHHLMKLRETIVNRLETHKELLPVEFTFLKKGQFLSTIGTTCIEAVLKQLEKQIPAPEGTGMTRTILNKRKTNMRREVIPESVRDDVLYSFLQIQVNSQVQDYEIAIRHPANILFPRGEAYFREMEEFVKNQIAEMGMDLKQELKTAVDTPKTLIKQYGKEARTWFDELGLDMDNIEATDIYTVILALKSSEILFDAATTTDKEKRIVAQSLQEYFQPQLKKLKEVQAELRARQES